MKFGVSIPFILDPGAKDPCHRPYKLCALAEGAGFDFLSIGHHVFTPDYPTSAPFTILSAIAARTSKIKLASIIYLLPLYHPVAVAEQVATLDVISGGRAILGVGVGYRPYEFEGFGVDLHQRGARTNEALSAIRSAWITGRFNHKGQHFQIPDLPAVPMPVQKPHIPMWIGGESGSALRRAATLGDAWISANMQPRDQLATLAETYRDLCAQENKTPFVCVSRDSWVSRSREDLLRDWYADTKQRHLGFKRMGLGVSVPDDFYARLERDEMSPEEFVSDRALAGTPDECVAQVKRWRDSIQCQAMLILLNKKASFEKVAAVIELFGKAVLPAARAGLA